MNALTSQPATFWMALVALLVSVASLLHTYRKSRLERQLDSLGRRSQLLFKLTDAESKAAIAKIKLMYSRSALGQLNSHPLLQSEVADAFFPGATSGLQQLDDMQVKPEMQLREIEGLINTLRTNCNSLDDNADPRKIEKLMPDAQSLQARIDTFSNLVAVATTTLENSLKTLDSNLKKLENAASEKQPGS